MFEEEGSYHVMLTLLRMEGARTRFVCRIDATDDIVATDALETLDIWVRNVLISNSSLLGRLLGTGVTGVLGIPESTSSAVSGIS